MKSITRADEIQAAVLRSKSGIWGAFDQGRWAHAIGQPRSPHPHGYHVNVGDWERGWDAEAAEVARQTACTA